MAQSAASPTPNVLKPPIAPSANAHSANPLFYPRKEFLRDQHRVLSSFSLLTFAGHGYVRLHGFPDSVINGLRRFFDQQQLMLSCRENVTNHFFEFTLDNKPWSNAKSLASERLIISILGVVFQYGFKFLSTIEYAREQDDKIALAFARPTTTPINASVSVVPNHNGSVSTLAHGGCPLFAISFPSTALLRVIEPPLSLTPAILQSVRNAWPRGINVEKKIGDSYEFKLRGYGWFQENTFASDSLQQILSLLSALDRHSFSLLTSLTLGSRSRTKDLWIFAGPMGDSHSVESPPESPVGSSLELKRDISPQHGGSSSEYRQSHTRSTSPYASSPLKQVTPSHSGSSNGKLRKPFPKAELPVAFRSESSLNEGRLPSEVGSVDMTGVGAHFRDASPSRTPEVFYTSGPGQIGNVYQQEFNPWNRAAVPFTNSAPHYVSIPFGRQHSRHHSISSTDDPVFRTSVPDSPYDVIRPPSHSSSSNNSRLRRASSPLSTSPMNPFPQPFFMGTPSETPPPAPGNNEADEADAAHFENEGKLGSEPPRIPTPLLSPGAFRDSAFSSSTGWRSTDIPIAWTGKDPEPKPNVDAKVPLTQFSVTRILPSGPPPGPPLGPRERRPSTGGPVIRSGQDPQLQTTQSQPVARRASSGPVFPGAWTLTPKEEKPLDDVAGNGTPTPPLTHSSSSTPNSSNMIPPTIAEQPSQEGDEVLKDVQARVPELRRAEGDGARKSEAAWVGNTLDRVASPPNETMPKAPAVTADTPTTNASTHPKRPNGPPRANSISEGWVLVNIDKSKGYAPGSSIRPSAQDSTQGSLRAPPLRHQRSRSDTDIPTLKTTAAMGGNSTMSPAAKAIVAVDAMRVKEASRQKAQTGRLRRLLGRSNRSGNGSPEPEVQPQTTSRSKSPPQQSHQRQETGSAEVRENRKRSPPAGRVQGGAIRAK